MVYDANEPDVEHESIVENLHKIQSEFEDLHKNIDSNKEPEKVVEDLVAKYKYSKNKPVKNKSTSHIEKAPEYAYVVYPDNSRIYYGNYNLEETEDNFRVHMNGGGYLEYLNQGYIYSGTFNDGLPTGFCFEKANSTIGIGTYIEGVLSGTACILDSSWLRVGEFENNQL